jgi:short-subunit dehydrogenase
MSGLIGVPYRTAYCSSKFAVNGFFEVLRNELNVKYRSQKGGSDRQVKITVVMPGWIDTGLRERHLVEAHHEQYKENDRSKVMSVEQCVHDVLIAIKKGKREERFIWKQKIVPLLKALSPASVDHLITKHVNANTLERQIVSKL